MAEKYVFLGELAEALHYAAADVLARRAKRMGITPGLYRNPKTGKISLAILAADAKRLVEQDIPKVETISPADLMKG
jgi:hypothetical protein